MNKRVILLIIAAMLVSCVVNTEISVRNQTSERLVIHDKFTGRTVRVKKDGAARFGGKVGLTVTNEGGQSWSYPEVNLHHGDLYHYWKKDPAAGVMLRLAVANGRALYVLNPVRNGGIAPLQPVGFPKKAIAGR